MAAQRVLSELRKLGKPNNVTVYARHGVSDPCLGVAYGDLKPLAKRIGRDQPLAVDLWSSGVHDARVLATMIADPERMAREQIERWLNECNNYILTDAVAGVAARMPAAFEMALAWIDGKGEWMTTAGWNVIGSIAARHLLSASIGGELLERIERTIAAQPNRTRYAMNNALIGIGSYAEPLRARALAVARTIGTVHVDHGATGCKTPDAASYIARVAAYNARKTADRKARPAAAGRRSAPSR